MYDEKEFDSVNGISSIYKLKNFIKNSNDKLENYDDDTSMFDIKPSDRNDVIFYCEKVALTLRKSLQNEENIDVFFDNIDDDFFDDYYSSEFRVSFDKEEKTFKIFSPLTIKNGFEKRNLKHNYTLMSYVRASIIRWKNENNIDLFHILKPPFILKISRKVLNVNSSVCDNDNIENGRIVNEIMNAIGYSDNPNNVSLFSTVELVSDTNDVGMEFTLFEKRAFFRSESDV